MDRLMKNIKYIPKNQLDTLWGLTICSVGFQHIEPLEEYPPRKIHESEYMFDPQRGRILSEYQLLYITEGKGKLVTKTSGVHNIKSGDLLIIFPGEWHSYKPDEQEGWSEYWIGFSGANMDSRVKHGFFSPSNPIYKVGHNEFLINLYEEAIRTAKRQEYCFQQLLAGIVNHMLGIIFMRGSIKEDESLKNELKIVNMAKNIMIESIENNIMMPDIARKLNISYTSFRRLFKKITGQSPAQYFINMRIQRAKKMLLGTDASIKEISLTLQFENPEYFSTMFKKKTGLSPQQFRNM